MNSNTILIPALIQIILTFVVYIALGVAKARATQSGQVDLDRRALFADAWPENVIKINNNIRNQFEVPVLFYVLTIIHWHLVPGNLISLALACLFVLSRILHAWIHTGTNIVRIRRPVFMFGCLVVALMTFQAVWAVIGVE